MVLYSAYDPFASRSIIYFSVLQGPATLDFKLQKFQGEKQQ